MIRISKFFAEFVDAPNHDDPPENKFTNIYLFLEIQHCTILQLFHNNYFDRVNLSKRILETK